MFLPVLDFFNTEVISLPKLEGVPKASKITKVEHIASLAPNTIRSYFSKQAFNNMTNLPSEDKIEKLIEAVSAYK